MLQAFYMTLCKKNAKNIILEVIIVYYKMNKYHNKEQHF